MKKGSLSLSVNAIVVLILAITMLGLGLGFIKGTFRQVSTQIEEKIAEESEPATPSGSEPITVSRGAMITQAGNDEVVKVAVYNPSNGPWEDEKPVIKCKEGTGLASINSPDYQSANARTIPPAGKENFNILLKMPKAAEGTYLCEVQVPSLTPEYYKDITIEITK